MKPATCTKRAAKVRRALFHCLRGGEVMETPRTFRALGDALKEGFHIDARLPSGGFYVRRFNHDTCAYEIGVVDAPSQRIPEIEDINASFRGQ